MRKVAILTNFRGYDPAYGLCRFVKNEVKMLTRGGYTPRLMLRSGYDAKVVKANYAGAKFIALDPGKDMGSNRVQVGADAEEDIQRLQEQLVEALVDVQVVITHDLIFQANLWKHHVAAKRIAMSRPDLRWIHVVHSASNLQTASKTGEYRQELQACQFPNSRLWVFARESVERMGNLYGYEVDQIVVIPPPMDFLGHMSPITQGIAAGANLMGADVILAYPCRLDRGKQPHVLIEIAHELQEMGYSARVILANSYSNAGDKEKYREEMRGRAREALVPLVLTSDHPECGVRTPHRVIMELLEISDVLVQPSMSESYSRVLGEAAWKRNALVLNYDLPLFREYDGLATFGKFSSAFDVHTGMHGETQTKYGDRRGYMKGLAAKIAYHIENNPVLKLHQTMRKERSIEGIWPKLQAVIEGDW